MWLWYWICIRFSSRLKFSSFTDVVVRSFNDKVSVSTSSKTTIQAWSVKLLRILLAPKKSHKWYNLLKVLKVVISSFKLKSFRNYFVCMYRVFIQREEFINISYIFWLNFTIFPVFFFTFNFLGKQPTNFNYFEHDNFRLWWPSIC